MSKPLEWMPRAYIGEPGTIEFDGLEADTTLGYWQSATILETPEREVPRKLYIPRGIDQVLATAAIAREGGIVALDFDQPNDAEIDGCRIRIDEQLNKLKEGK